jgi:hypothetical protein
MSSGLKENMSINQIELHINRPTHPADSGKRIQSALITNKLNSVDRSKGVPYSNKGNKTGLSP